MQFIIDTREHQINSSESKTLENVVAIIGSDNQSIELNEVISNLTIQKNDIIKGKKVIGKIVKVASPDDMSKILSNQEKYELLIIQTDSWHVIPLENLAAKYDGSETKLFCQASNLEEIVLLANVLEIGIAGCVISGDKLDLITQYHNKTSSQALDLEEFKVHSVRKLEIGDRVCVDTCSILKKGEGLLVGSTSNLFILVQAEVEESGFVKARPFRINAGVVASYLLNFDKTNYLSELSAGESVMVVDYRGKVRKEAVARIKIERRPMIILQISGENRTFPVILQDAETVKIITKNGSIPITEIKAGDLILGLSVAKARHFGMEVNEFIEER